MRTSRLTHPLRARRGYASLLMVTSVAAVLLTLILFSYRAAIRSQQTQAASQLRIDYAQKENAFLRALVATVPNRAMGLMQDNSAGDPAYGWEQIFRDCLELSNAEAAMTSDAAAELGLDGFQYANTGNILGTESEALDISSIIERPFGNTGLVGPGVGSPESGFPETLIASYSGSAGLESTYPVITPEKHYGLQAGEYQHFKAMPYPNIHFGYGKPGDDFVAKHNWWAFKLNLGGRDRDVTGVGQTSKTYILSLYEIPSQLPISAAAVTQIGGHGGGGAWQNVNIDGGVFGRELRVTDGATAQRLASRMGITAAGSMTVGGVTTDSSFRARGVRESYEIANEEFFPVSEVGDSGRVSFIPINRGNEFFDYYADPDPTNVEGPTPWRDYSIGARQCAMRLAVVEVESDLNQAPTKLEFAYRTNGGGENTLVLSRGIGDADFIPGPFKLEQLDTGRNCIVVDVDALRGFLGSLADAASEDVNHSLAVNADHRGSPVRKPGEDPATDTAVILRGGRDLTDFDNGFSLVTNFVLYLDDDFNIVQKNNKFPPASLFAPEQRYGTNEDPLWVDITGQLGSLAKSDDPVHLLDLKTGKPGGSVDTDKIRATLSTISDPDELPPVVTMNWLTVVKEKIE